MDLIIRRKQKGLSIVERLSTEWRFHCIAVHVHSQRQLLELQCISQIYTASQNLELYIYHKKGKAQVLKSKKPYNVLITPTSKVYSRILLKRIKQRVGKGEGHQCYITRGLSWFLW